MAITRLWIHYLRKEPKLTLRMKWGYTYCGPVITWWLKISFHMFTQSLEVDIHDPNKSIYLCHKLHSLWSIMGVDKYVVMHTRYEMWSNTKVTNLRSLSLKGNLNKLLCVCGGGGGGGGVIELQTSGNVGYLWLKIQNTFVRCWRTQFEWWYFEVFCSNTWNV